MEKISINQEKQLYEIESIRPVSVHVLQIVFVNAVPKTYGDIQVYTTGGYQCANLPGYSTVFRNEGKVVYLSDDGSIYQPPEDPGEQLPLEPYLPTLEDGNMEHFSLTEHDQLNLFGKQTQLAAGAERLEYHADGQPCRYYSAADIQSIIQAAMFHVSYHTTYCNALNMWIAGCQESEEVMRIYYGADVPEEYRSEVLNEYLLQIADMAGRNTDESEH